MAQSQRAQVWQGSAGTHESCKYNPFVALWQAALPGVGEGGGGSAARDEQAGWCEEPHCIYNCTRQDGK